MTRITRRDTLRGGTGILLASAATTGTMGASAMATASIADDLADYIGFGSKVSGGPGDRATGQWVEDKLSSVGFTVEEQMIDVPWFEPSEARLALDDGATPATAALLPMAIVIPTAPQGLSGRLVHVHPVSGPQSSLQGAIALIELPHARWSSALARPIREPLVQAAEAGAIGAVLVTTGPTGGAIALNADGNNRLVTIPVGIIAPAFADPFLIAAKQGGMARMILTGRGGRRPAANLAARIDRNAAQWIVVSTPRSGWTTCAGERGPGIAAFLALARWAPAALPDHNLLFLCNSGHEYENLGADRALDSLAPSPATTSMWLHLGANVAARDWHDAGQQRLLPLLSADPQRYLVTSTDLVDRARTCFEGVPGLGNPYSAQSGTAGELSHIVARGYPRFAGIFGAHRFHHVAEDDARCVHPPLVEEVTARLKSLLLGAVA